jgi:hypothetical protein
VRVDDPIDVSRISKWTGTINEAGRRKLKRRIGRIGEFWGYTVDDALALEPLRADGRLLIRGDDVQARIRQFTDIDFSTQPPIPRADQFYHPRDVKLAAALPEQEEAAEERPWPRTRLRRVALPVVRRLPRPARRRLAALARRRWEAGLSESSAKPGSG